MTAPSRPSSLETGPRAAQNRFYRGLDRSAGAYRRLVEQFEPPDRVLEIGSRIGNGIDGAAFDLAARGVQVVSVDVSPGMVERGRLAAADQGLQTVVHRQMSIEELDLASDSFDGVIGSSVLHDVDVARAYAEISRVLEPDGVAIFVEPLGHNPLINAYRRRTPGARDTYAHPLRREDFSLARRWFRDVTVSPYHMMSVLAGPLSSSPVGRGLQRALSNMDRALLRAVPRLRWQAWIAIVELREPR